MCGVLCHGQRPSLMWKDVQCGVIRYNALLDDAGQQHVMEERCLLPDSKTTPYTRDTLQINVDRGMC